MNDSIDSQIGSGSPLNVDCVKLTIQELQKHSPDILDETGECPTCNGMIMLSEMIGEFP